MIDLKTTLFIVDGPSDASSFDKKFKTLFGQAPHINRPAKNGKDVTAESYVNSISGYLNKALRGSFRHIICILDREERQPTAVEFGNSVLEEIQKQLSRKFNDDQLKKITVVVSDRCFENWIVADIEGIKKKQDLIPQDNAQDNFEGRNGAAILKKITSGKYDKTAHAKLLFNCVRFDVARVNSTSFDRFCSTINYP
ncbi:MAG: DUF4276 family protein [Candidatus Magnetobacterium sp. LHC-1]